MKKGSKLVSNTTSSFWNLAKGEELTALSGQYFRNGEYHIKTAKGEFPVTFFY